MIILEGPDGSGKTTLLNKLTKEFDLPVAEKSVDSSTKARTDLKRYTEDTINAGLQRMIFDRHPVISEPIYAAAIRHTVKEGFDSMGWLTGQLVKLNRFRPFIIYCLPPLKTVAENVYNSPVMQPESVLEKIDVIWGAYAALAARQVSVGSAVVHDYTVDGSDLRISMMLRNWLGAQPWNGSQR